MMHTLGNINANSFKAALNVDNYASIMSHNAL